MRITWQTVWASAYKTNLRRLVILQKRIIRIINKSHFNAHTDPIFKDLGILKFNDIHLLQLGQFMYSCKNSFLPPRFNNNFSQSTQFHSYNKEISEPNVYRIVAQTLRSSRTFFKGLSFLIHLTTRSSTLNPFPLLRKNWRLNYWVRMITVHKSFHLRLFAIFSSIDVKQL